MCGWRRDPQRRKHTSSAREGVREGRVRRMGVKLGSAMVVVSREEKREGKAREGRSEKKGGFRGRASPRDGRLHAP